MLKTTDVEVDVGLALVPLEPPRVAVPWLPLDTGSSVFAGGKTTASANRFADLERERAQRAVTEAFDRVLHDKD